MGIRTTITSLNRFEQFFAQKDSQDKIVWLGQEDGLFFVRSSYDVLKSFIPLEPCLTLESLWDIKVLLNALFLAWRILKGKLSTRMNLSKRGVNLLSLLCPLCNQVEE